jgi:heme/copper-type cytochrome/quinol oxidase subunit 3
MWLFIGSELMFFTAFFAMYIIMRNAHPELKPPHSIEGLMESVRGTFDTLRWMFGAKIAPVEGAVPQPNVFIAGINTFILVTSSLFMTRAVNASKEGDSKVTSFNLFLTAMSGLVFLLFKTVEYLGEIREHLLPSTNIFYSCYYTMTGFHGLHILIGVVILLVLAWRARRGDFTRTYNSPVEVCGLYWSLVEAVWFFLFPILYLV